MYLSLIAFVHEYWGADHAVCVYIWLYVLPSLFIYIHLFRRCLYLEQLKMCLKVVTTLREIMGNLVKIIKGFHNEIVV